MDINELSGVIAADIKEAKKTRRRGYVAFAIKKNAHEISALLNESFYKVPDLYGSVADELGGEPCNIRSFRELCDKYCTDETASLPRKEKASEKPGTEVKDENVSQNARPGVEEEKDIALDGLGSEWQEIVDSLGPAKKQQLPRAISRGLTLKEAKEARSISVKQLQDILTTYSKRKR